MKKITLTNIALPLLLASMCPSAFAQEVEVNISVDYASEYVFRGTTLAADVLQPGVEATYGNFTFGGWASFPIAESDAYDTEIDLYAGYAFALSDTITADIGATLYHYPESGGLFDIGTDADDASTLELYASFGFQGALEPSLTAYYDLTLEAFTVEGSVGYSVPVTDKTSFDMGATVGAVTVDGSGDYQYGSLSGALTYAVSDAVSSYVGINAGLSSEDTFHKLSNFTPRSSSVWFGAGISTGF